MDRGTTAHSLAAELEKRSPDGMNNNPNCCPKSVERKEKDQISYQRYQGSPFFPVVTVETL